MGETKNTYSGQKWTLQLTKKQADNAERFRRISGQNRQEILSAALDEYIERHEKECLNEIQKLMNPQQKGANNEKQ